MVDFPAGDYWRVQEAIDTTGSIFKAGKAVFASARKLKRKQRKERGIDEPRFKRQVIVSLEALIYSMSLFCEHFGNHDMRKPEMLALCSGAIDSAMRCIMTDSTRDLFNRIRDSMN